MEKLIILYITLSVLFIVCMAGRWSTGTFRDGALKAFLFLLGILGNFIILTELQKLLT